MTRGRFAPSPSGDLHLGNLRTALAAWLFARSRNGEFVMRIEDLDPTTSDPQVADGQLADLAALGLDWDGEPVRQSDRRDLHLDAINELHRAGLVYRCWCSRRDIADAPRAPHVPAGHYPGTCRDLSASEIARHEASGKPPALRLRTPRQHLTVTDELQGEHAETVDDFVLQRGDGTPAYNLVVVVDDATQGINQVVRGRDLLTSTPRQAHLYDVLGQPRPSWVHVPLVLGPSGDRLAKRDGAVTLADQRVAGRGDAQVLAGLARSLGVAIEDREATIGEVLEQFDPADVVTSDTDFESLLGHLSPAPTKT